MQNQLRKYGFVIFVGLFIGVLGVSGILALLQREAPTELEQPHAGSSLHESDLKRSQPTRSSSFGGESSQYAPTNLDELVFPKSAFDRKLSILSQVATLSEDQLFDWLKQSTDPSWSVGSAIRREVKFALLRRLADLAPEETLDFAWSLEYDEREFMATIVLSTWARADLDKTVSYLQNEKNQSMIRLIPTILRARDELNLSQLRELAHALGDESSAFTVYLEKLVPAKIENPRKTWFEVVSFLDREDMKDLTSESLNQLAVALVREEGLSTLNEIKFHLSRPAIREVLLVLFSDKPAETFDYALDNLGANGEAFIQTTGIWSLAQHDPARLVARIETLLDREFLKEYVIDAIYTAADNSPRQLLEVFDELPQQLKLGASYRAVINLRPNEATQFIMNLSEPALKRELASRFFWHWSRENIDEARNWVTNLPESEPVRSALMRSLVQVLVSTKPNEAFQIALEQPPIEPQNFHGWIGEASVLMSILRTDVDLAVQLLPKVRDVGDYRLHAYSRAGATLIRNGESKRAIALASQLSSEEQVDYFQHIAWTWVNADPQGLYNELSAFPSDKIKSEVAVLMVRHAGAHSDTYSSEQLALVNKLILKEDLDRLNESNL